MWNVMSMLAWAYLDLRTEASLNRHQLSFCLSHFLPRAHSHASLSIVALSISALVYTEMQSALLYYWRVLSRSRPFSCCVQDYKSWPNEWLPFVIAAVGTPIREAVCWFSPWNIVPSAALVTAPASMTAFSIRQHCRTRRMLHVLGSYILLSIAYSKTRW